MEEIANLAWLAGIIDGEGSIFIMKQQRHDRDRKFNYILRISVQSTDPFMAPLCKEIAGVGEALQVMIDKRPNMSNTLKWQCNGRLAVSLLKRILPYMKVKHEQAKLAIAFQETTKKHWKHMTELDYQSQAEFYVKLKQSKIDLKIGKTSMEI